MACNKFSTDFRAIVRGIIQNPAETCRRLILRDWLQEVAGCDEFTAAEAIEPPVWSSFLPMHYYCNIGMGRGIGIGGSGMGSATDVMEAIMEIGKTYLIQTVDWFTWVGRCKRQVGPWEYEFESVSKISATNAGDNWHLLAAGDQAARKAASYCHYSTPIILGMGAVAKIVWLGNTPQEEGL